MTTTGKLTAFAAALAVLAGGGAAAGKALGPSPIGGAAAAPEHGEMAMAVRGLAVADHGLRLVVDDRDIVRGQTTQLRFRIRDEQGGAVRDFDVEHTKRMHLIVVRRDLTGFQHLHPAMSADGTWTTPLRLDTAGSYRLFADFSHDDEPITLASDLRIDGTTNLESLPAPATTATSGGGYQVRLQSTARAGEETELRFNVTRHGNPVTVQPYLGADGHLIALRDGDLGFLHVHPADGGDHQTIRFDVTFPTPGAYRLFLQFQHQGSVQTVSFTQQVTQP
jgi:hypothetical protein